MRIPALIAVFLTWLTPVMAQEGESCGPGAPAGMEAFANGIIVRICTSETIYIDKDLTAPDAVMATLKERMTKKKKKPVTVFTHVFESSELVDELQAFVIDAPKGSGMFYVAPDGLFLGSRND